MKTGGNWSTLESQNHINYLELLAVCFSVQSLCKDTKDCHIKVYSDNTTTVAYLNNMGGTKELWCYNNWITSTHLPGKYNQVADKLSRSIHDNMEWKLHPDLFSQIYDKLGIPEIDLFASRLNSQLSVYCSWKPDPGAKAIDAMMIDWAP